MKISSFKGNKKYNELKKEYDNNLEIMQKNFNTALESHKSFISDLLFQNSDLKISVAKLEQKNEFLSKLTNQNIELSDELETVRNQLLELNTKYKYLCNAQGGYKSENTKLKEQIGAYKMYEQLLLDKLNKYQIPRPTLQELKEYEITHKTPKRFKKDGIIQS